jgi:hypothetical protein
VCVVISPDSQQQRIQGAYRIEKYLYQDIIQQIILNDDAVYELEEAC